MSITNPSEMEGMKEISDICGLVLKRMREHAAPGMSAKELDDFGGKILTEMGAISAPKKAYKFPGHTCICVNKQVAHGIPKASTILKEGDLVNIDVSAEKNDFWSDNGGSFVLGEDIHNHQPLVNASKEILQKALSNIKGGVKISLIGAIIEKEAKLRGFKVIKNLAGHGVGRSLHEDPENILNYYVRSNKQRFRKNSVVAVETFISTKSVNAVEQGDGWTLVGNFGGFVAQHEHTIMVTAEEPLILTASNEIY